MKKAFSNIAGTRLLARWAREEDGAAFIEAVILLPVLVSMLMVCFDIGQGITTNQKVIGASQIMGDLIARSRTLTFANVEDIINAGELAIDPYDKTPFGYDIASIQFDSSGRPIVLWRVAYNTEDNDAAVASTRGLGAAGDGMIVVTTTYKYNPLFSRLVAGTIDMKEVAFLHARRSATVTCADCPPG